MIKSALTLYHWFMWQGFMRQGFMRQALTGGQVAAPKPAGEEAVVSEGKGNRLSPEELGILAEQLTTVSNPAESARMKECLTRGFYGI